MNFSAIKNITRYTLPYWFGLLFFIAQLSTSLKIFPLIIIILSLFLLPDVKYRFIQVLKTTWCQVALLLFIVVLAACFIGPATFIKKLSVLKQYNKLLYLPLLAIGLSYPKTKYWALRGFLAAMTVTAILSIVSYFELIASLNMQFDDIFFNHIMTGFAMSFAALLSIYYALEHTNKAKFIYFSLFLLFTFHVLFINLGRTGYVIYAFMLGLFAVTHLPLKKSVIALMMLLGILTTAYFFNSSTKLRVNEAISNYQHYNKNKNTSIGFRLQFHSYAIQLFKRHPLIGNGTASFSTLFYKENPVPEFGKNINEPHGIYWLFAAEYGMFGLFALIIFFVSLLLAACRLDTMRTPALIFILGFMIVNLTDSLLFYSASGYLFILFCAFFLSDKLRPVNTCLI